MSLHNVPCHNPDENIITLACRLKRTRYLVVPPPPLRSGILVRVVAWQASAGMKRVESLVVGLIMAHCLRRLQCVETKHRLLFFSASGKNLKMCRLGKAVRAAAHLLFVPWGPEFQLTLLSLISTNVSATSLPVRQQL